MCFLKIFTNVNHPLHSFFFEEKTGPEINFNFCFKKIFACLVKQNTILYYLVHSNSLLTYSDANLKIVNGYALLVRLNNLDD